MAYGQDRRVTAGQLISGTFEELALAKREIALYLAGFFVAGLIAQFASGFVDLIAIPAMIAYFVAQYFLYRIILKRGGIMYDPRFKVFSFFGIAAVLFVPIYIGFSFFVVPGVLIASKFIMTPAYLVAEDRSLYDCFGSSWGASDRNTVSIALAFTALCLIWTGILLIAGGLGGAAFEQVSAGFSGSNAFFWMVIHILPLMLMGLSIRAYRMLSDHHSNFTEVFE